MSKIDDAIKNVAYILDTLRAYRDIAESGCCNECACKRHCPDAPAPGQLVRYNCAGFVRDMEGEHD